MSVLLCDWPAAEQSGVERERGQRGVLQSRAALRPPRPNGPLGEFVEREKERESSIHTYAGMHTHTYAGMHTHTHSHRQTHQVAPGLTLTCV